MEPADRRPAPGPLSGAGSTSVPLPIAEFTVELAAHCSRQLGPSVVRTRSLSSNSLVRDPSRTLDTRVNYKFVMSYRVQHPRSS